jgi:hypothetical protein
LINSEKKNTSWVFNNNIGRFLVSFKKTSAETVEKPKALNNAYNSQDRDWTGMRRYQKARIAGAKALFSL